MFVLIFFMMIGFFDVDLANDGLSDGLFCGGFVVVGGWGLFGQSLSGFKLRMWGRLCPPRCG